MDKYESSENISENDNQKTVLSKIQEAVRLSWKDFIRNQSKIIIGFAIMITMILIIINLSKEIADPNTLNPKNILELNTQSQLIMFILSILMYLIVLSFFIKVILIDKKEVYEIKKWLSPKGIWSFILSFSFVTLIYILLDIALINIFVYFGPAIITHTLDQTYDQINLFSGNTDRLTYSRIRAFYFQIFLLIIISFPIIMSLAIFTRFGRKFLKKNFEKNTHKLSIKQRLLFLFTPFIEIVLLFVVFVLASYDTPLYLVPALVMIGLALWWIIILLIIIIKFVWYTALISYSNLLMIFPIVGLFYIVPGIIWATWDLAYIFTNNISATTLSRSNTIYGITNSPGNIDIGTGLKSMSLERLTSFYLQTIILNLGNFIRILELDFIIIIGISAVMIGFVEGYSILAILRSIRYGVAIAKTGKVATQSAPKIIVITTRLIYLFIWLELLWDKFIILWNSLSLSLFSWLPEIKLPTFLNIIISFTIDLSSASKLLLPLAILLVPFYFIVSSSFKFLSVSLVLEKIKEDDKVYFLMISSAFILIIAQIYGDISSISEFQG
ncbi:MAG: hypothetical protein OEY49_19375, partial [Candidatus Heimdallarchaeota archaeon]|nr:hypothetical protein [Candidatus Heimdallarchaeota archaeon]